jgi:NCS2 family nucleobase:cation symporter-2
LAGKLGGLPLLFGLTAISGLFEALLSRLVQRLRVIFPPEVHGSGRRNGGNRVHCFGPPQGFSTSSPSRSRIDPRAVFVAALSLAAMIGPSIWSRENSSSTRYCCSLKDHVQQVFDLSGFSSILAIYGSREDGIKGL